MEKQHGLPTSDHNNTEIFTNNESEIKKVSNFRRKLPQVLAGFSKTLIMFDLGTISAIKPIIIANIINVTSQLSFTDAEASWFASLMLIAQPVGCFLSIWILEHVGRKKALMFLNISLFVSWIITDFANSVPLLYLSSFTSGLGIGLVDAPTITYIGEITEPSVRGILTSLCETSIGVGTLLVFILGVYLDWRTIAYICTAIPVISFIVISQVPESPIWLLAQNRTEEAEKALCWLRGWVEPKLVQDEFSKLVLYKNNKISRNAVLKGYSNNEEIQKKNEFVEDNTYKNKDINSMTENNLNNENNKYCETRKLEKGKLSNMISNLSEPKMLRALFLMIGFFFFSSANGYVAVRSYSVQVFKELGISVEPYRANMVSGIGYILGAMTLMILVRFTGKRKIVLFSYIGTTATFIALGFYTFHKTKQTVSLVPFIIYTAHVYFSGLGVLTMPWLYISEIFPYRGRGAATAIAASLFYFYSFVVTKTFYTITDAITLPGTFFFYGLMSLFGFIYVYFLLPETEGKTLQDIEDEAG